MITSREQLMAASPAHLSSVSENLAIILMVTPFANWRKQLPTLLSAQRGLYLWTGYDRRDHKRMRHARKISYRQPISVAWYLIPFGALHRWLLNSTKLDPDRPDGCLSLTASAFNQLGPYTSSPGRRSYCYAELAVFFPAAVAVTVDNTHCA